MCYYYITPNEKGGLDLSSTQRVPMMSRASLLFGLIASCLLPVTSSKSQQLATPSPMTSPSSISLYLNQIRISSVTCFQNSMCSLELWGQGIPEQSLRPDSLAQYDIDKVDRSFRCGLDAERNDPTCCYEIMSRFNEQRTTTNRGVFELLQDLNCSKIYCSSLRCGIIGCQAPFSCYDSPTDGQTAPDTTPASSSPSVSSLVDPVTGVIIGCVVAFFAGVGGAVLITWLCRRKPSPARDRTPSSSNTETTSAGSIRGDSMYEELPEGELKKKKSGPRTERVSMENEYTYIPDYSSYNSSARAPQPPPPATSSPTTTTTTTAPTAIAYNVPGDHLSSAGSHRQLPNAPAPPARPDTGDHNATRGGLPETRDQNAGPNGGGDHATRGWVRSGGQLVTGAALATAGGGGGRGGDTSPQPGAGPQLFQGTDTSADRPYFVLEDQQQQQQQQQQQPQPQHHQQQHQQQLAPSSPRVSRPLPKPRLTVSSRPPLPNPREVTSTVSTGTAAGSISGPRGDYYSPLQAARDGEEEYTTLDKGYAVGGGGAGLPAPPEYLELVPVVEEYSLQKPVE